MKSLALILLLAAGCVRNLELQVYGPAPDFMLTERSSRAVTRQDLDGQVWIADFIFTQCGGICPLMTKEMRKLQDQLPAEIRLVSFSVDPTHDTPEVLRAYADENGADRDRWLFLTGERDVMYRISKDGFKLAVDDTQGTPAEPITHSTRFVLVDRQGRIRGYYGMEDKDAMARLMADAKQL
jgi:protein SCO1